MELDDPSSHAKVSIWKVRDATLQFSKNDYGMVLDCTSSGSMALVQPASPFLTDNVVVQFDVMLQSDSKREGVLGFVFRYDSSSNFYRFEWQPEDGCVSVVHYEGRYKRRDATVLGSLKDHKMIQDQYYHVTISMVAAKIDVSVRGVNRNGYSVASRDEFELSVVDPKYQVCLKKFILFRFV